MLTTVLIVTLLCFLTVYGIYVWALRRGYDVTDEAIFLMQTDRPEDVICYPFFDFVYSAHIWRLTKGSIPFHRLLVAVCFLVSTAIFAWGLIEFIGGFDSSVALPGVLVAAIFLGLAVIQLHAVAPCLRLLFYNNLTGMSLLIQAGCMMLAIEHPAWQFGLYVCIGFVFAMQFFVKISSFCANGCAHLVVSGGLMLSGWLAPLPATSGFLLGCGALVTFHFTCLQSYANWKQAFFKQVETAQNFDWGVGCLPRHFDTLKDYTKHIFFYQRTTFLAVALGTIGLGVLPYEGEQLQVAATVMCAAVLTHFLCVVAHYRGYLHFWYDPKFSAQGFLFNTLLVTSLLSFSVMITLPEHAAAANLNVGMKATLICLYLFGIPVLGAVGTGNAIYVNFAYQLASWGGLILLELFWLGAVLEAPAFTPIALVVMSCIATGQFVFGFVYQPYRLNGNLLQQTVPTRINNDQSMLLLDPASHQFFTDIRTNLEKNGFQDGDDIIGLFDVPGIVFAVGAHSPGHQWYYIIPNHFDTMMQTNHMHLATVEPERLQKAFIIEQDDITHFSPYLDKLELDFPNGYGLGAHFISPYSGKSIKVWKPEQELQADNPAAVNFKIANVNRLALEGKKAEACEQMSIVAAEHPDLEHVQAEFGHILMNAGRLTEASTVFENLIALAPANIEAALGLAILGLSQRDVPKAELWAFKALEIDSNSITALKILGLVKKSTGAFDEARQYIEQALRVNPHDAELQRDLRSLPATPA
jgi:tetratricopeptide (TPR) repeat protein/small basic protein